MLQVTLNRRRLGEYLARHCLSQRNFARKAGFSSGYMTQLLSGNRSPSPEARARLLDATGMNFDDLFHIVGGEEGHYA